MTVRGVAAEGGVARVHVVVAVIAAVVVVHESALAAVAEGRLASIAEGRLAAIAEGRLPDRAGRMPVAAAVPHLLAVGVSARAYSKRGVKLGQVLSREILLKLQ